MNRIILLLCLLASQQCAVRAASELEKAMVILSGPFRDVDDSARTTFTNAWAAGRIAEIAEIAGRRELHYFEPALIAALPSAKEPIPSYYLALLDALTKIGRMPSFVQLDWLFSTRRDIFTDPTLGPRTLDCMSSISPESALHEIIRICSADTNGLYVSVATNLLYSAGEDLQRLGPWLIFLRPEGSNAGGHSFFKPDIPVVGNLLYLPLNSLLGTFAHKVEAICSKAGVIDANLLPAILLRTYAQEPLLHKFVGYPSTQFLSVPKQTWLSEIMRRNGQRASLSPPEIDALAAQRIVLAQSIFDLICSDYGLSPADNAKTVSLPVGSWTPPGVLIPWTPEQRAMALNDPAILAQTVIPSLMAALRQKYGDERERFSIASMLFRQDLREQLSLAVGIISARENDLLPKVAVPLDKLVDAYNQAVATLKQGAHFQTKFEEIKPNGQTLEPLDSDTLHTLQKIVLRNRSIDPLHLTFVELCAVKDAQTNQVIAWTGTVPTGYKHLIDNYPYLLDLLQVSLAETEWASQNAQPSTALEMIYLYPEITAPLIFYFLGRPDLTFEHLTSLLQLEVPATHSFDWDGPRTQSLFWFENNGPSSLSMDMPIITLSGGKLYDIRSNLFTGFFTQEQQTQLTDGLKQAFDLRVNQKILRLADERLQNEVRQLDDTIPNPSSGIFGTIPYISDVIPGARYRNDNKFNTLDHYAQVINNAKIVEQQLQSFDTKRLNGIGLKTVQTYRLLFNTEFSFVTQILKFTLNDSSSCVTWQSGERKLSKFEAQGLIACPDVFNDADLDFYGTFAGWQENLVSKFKANQTAQAKRLELHHKLRATLLSGSEAIAGVNVAPLIGPANVKRGRQLCDIQRDLQNLAQNYSVAIGFSNSITLLDDAYLKALLDQANNLESTIQKTAIDQTQEAVEKYEQEINNHFVMVAVSFGDSGVYALQMYGSWGGGHGVGITAIRTDGGIVAIPGQVPLGYLSVCDFNQASPADRFSPMWLRSEGDSVLSTLGASPTEKSITYSRSPASLMLAGSFLDPSNFSSENAKSQEAFDKAVQKLDAIRPAVVTTSLELASIERVWDGSLNVLWQLKYRAFNGSILTLSRLSETPPLLKTIIRQNHLNEHAYDDAMAYIASTCNHVPTEMPPEFYESATRGKALIANIALSDDSKKQMEDLKERLNGFFETTMGQRAQPALATRPFLIPGGAESVSPFLLKRGLVARSNYGDVVDGMYAQYLTAFGQRMLHGKLAFARQNFFYTKE